MSLFRILLLLVLEAIVPERPVVLPKDEIGDRMVRAMCITMSAMAWRGAFDAVSLMSLAEEYEDYIMGGSREVSDAELIAKITGRKR